MSNSFVTPQTIQPAMLLRPWDFPSNSTGVCCYFLLQGIFLTQGSHLGPALARAVTNPEPPGSPFISNQFSSVQSLSCVWLFVTPSPTAHQTSLLSPTPGAYANSCPLSQWCRPTISSSVVPFSTCLKYFQEFRSFPVNQFFPSHGQSTGVSASTSVLPKNIQHWFPLGLTGLISLQSKGLSRVFNTTIQKHQFFGTQLSL